MDNLEYLKKVKENNIDFDLIQEYDLRYRQVNALEIIAEELCIANKLKTALVENPVYVMENAEATNICRKIEMSLKEMTSKKLKYPKGFTKKVMDKIKKRGGVNKY